MSKKTRAQKERSMHHRMKQLDEIVKAGSIHSTPLLPPSVALNVNQKVVPIPEPVLPFAGSEAKYLSSDIRKCLILGGLFFVAILALYFLENQYHFLMPLGDLLMNLLLG